MYAKDEIKTPRIFRPFGNIVINSTTASTAAVPMILETGSGSEQPHVRICNTGTDMVQFNFATGTAGTAGSNSAYLLGGVTGLFDRGLNTHIAVIASTGTIPVSVTTGFGILD